MVASDQRLTKARQLLSAGREAEALPLLEGAFGDLSDKDQKLDLAAFLGVAHGRAGRIEDAERWFAKALDLVPGQPSVLFERGQLRERHGERGRALADYLTALRGGSRNARHFLAAGAVLDKLGRMNEALEVWSLGNDLDEMLTKAHQHPGADPQTKRRSKKADEALRVHFSSLHRRTVEEQGGSNKLLRIRDAVWPQTHEEDVRFAHPRQRPMFFYIPELEPIPVFEGKDLPWASSLEASTKAIRDEFLEAVAGGAKGDPYVHQNTMRSRQWDALRGQDRWEALHLFKNGQQADDLTARFPKTLEALDRVPLVRPEGKPLEVFFSVLKPGTHIPPHFGLSNARLTVHLPLIVPDDCGIRVSDETYGWREGEVFAFDDSFEHEAWNRSGETRVVLIFEAWSPGLTEAERDAVNASYQSRLSWLRGRTIPEA